VAKAFTLDLTALAGSNLATFDATGLKIKALQMSCPESNANGIILVNGAVDGYPLITPNLIWNLEPGDMTLWVFNDTQVTVSTNDRNLDFSSLGDTEETDILIVFGP